MIKSIIISILLIAMLPAYFLAESVVEVLLIWTSIIFSIIIIFLMIIISMRALNRATSKYSRKK